MKKRILCILLTLCMVLMLVPITVFAADNVGGLDDLLSVLNKGGTQKLNKDYVIDQRTISVGKSITIDLNGHVIRFNGGRFNVGYKGKENITLTIKDNNPKATHSGQFEGLPDGGVITSSYGGTYGGAVQVCYEKCTFNLESGTIYNCKANTGGCVYIDAGTFNMKGGTIDSCTATDDCGAVCLVSNNSIFNMTGGTIENCSAKSNGGGVCHESTDAGAASFTMTDGTIKNCSAENGGGVDTVQNFKDLTFTMTGGTIDNCSAKIFGGGMCIEKNGDCTLEGGTINNCSADYGGGVFVKRGDFIMKSGTIKNCFARTSVGSYGYGGGINTYYSTFTMTGGTVKDCASTYSENDTLCLFANSTMTADGGSINGTSIIYSLNNTISKIKNTSPAKYTKFYGFVENKGTISGGVFYGGIQNKGSGTITNPYKIVTFDLNGATGSVPNQWLVNAKGATANRPTDPTWEGYKFMGWYNGNTVYDFTTAVPDNIKIFTLKAKWVNSRVSTEAELKEAINAGITSIKLVSDFELSSKLDLSDKDITLDLNGHILTGNIKLSDTIKEKNPSKLTLIDSNPTATHTNSNLPLGGVLDGEITLDKTSFGSLSRLCANGGTVTGQVVLNDSNTQIVCTSTTPTAFMDYVKGSGAIHGGMFYGGVKQGCIEEEIVTFLRDGQRYAVGVVEFGQKAVAPVEPVKDGYVFAGWYIGNTKYSFQQPVIQDVVLNAKWVNEVTDEETLRSAINEGLTTIKLMADINLSSALDLSQKDITIDLNGHVISGADISINTGKGKASLTLIDSNPTATHTDNTLPKGGVVTSKISMKQDGGGYNDCVLYANGGTVTSEFTTNTNAVAIKCTSNTPTAFTWKISGYTHLYGGIYYGTVNSSVTFEESKITFKNGDSNYAYEVLSSDKKSFEPISPSVMTGYQAFDGWYNGNTKYTFGSSLSQDITLTAKYKNPLTYNITYNLGGGTATNPTSYTVESDAIRLNNPVKAGYTFTGWSGTGLTGENNMAVTIDKGSTGERAYTAHFSQNSYTVAFDTVGGSSISDKTGVKWTDQVLDGITAPTKDGWEFTGWKCGDMTVNANTKYSDLAENDTVTLVAQWKDIQKPVISGIENGKTYCDAVQFEVSDNDGIASVKAGKNKVTADTNGQYTLEKGIGTVTVVVTDNAGNKKEMTVTVNDGHTAGNDDDDCSTPVYCIYHPDTVVVAAKSHDFSGEWHNDGTGHWHVCQNDGCTVSETETPHFGTDDGDCTTVVICECGYVITAANAEHSYGEWQSNGDGTHTRYCTVDGCSGYEDGNCDGGKASYFNKAVCDTCHAEYGELLTDSTAPTGEITVGTNKWNSFLNTITFGLFFKDTQSVTITAADDSYGHDDYTDDKAVKVEYYLYSGDTALTQADLAGKEFTEYSRAFNINPDNKYVIYAKLTDHASNVTYISSEGVVLDASAPVISGVENGKVYCEAQTVTVTEEYIESVKVNGTAVTLDANNQFTLNPAEGTQTIVVTDNAGNETSVTVTVNDGHTAGNDDDDCSTPVYCIYHPDTVVVAAKSHDFSSEWQSNGDGTHTRYCTVDGCNGSEDGDCEGGEATCTSKAICEYCKTEYGEFDSSNHNIEKIPAKDATVTATGNKEYWHCKDCKKYFSDAAGKNEIKLDDTIISKLSPEIIEGKGQSITAGDKKALSFTSNAAFSDFIRVELDGKTLDEKNYTVKEGSTVVTLKADYVATLSAGEHTIGIVSESGTATATFTVNVKAVVDNDTKSPQTGDNSHMALWIALLAASVFGLAGTAVYSKRKRVR